MSINVEELNDLQQQLKAGHSVQAGHWDALIAELRRLKTVISGKTIEADAAREQARELETLLEALVDENEKLQAEIDELKSVHGLPICQLEGRWTNCAVRMRKAFAKD